MIRQAKPEDFDSIDHIKKNGDPDGRHEASESFRSKILGCPEGCFVCEVDKEVVGYIISFPYTLWEYFPINESYRKVEDPDCHYIYDFCVDKKHRGKGYDISLVDAVLRIKSNPKVLVSSLDSEGFWKNFGFQSQKTVDHQGSNFVYMVKT